MDAVSLEMLEFPELLAHLASYARTSQGKRWLEQRRPTADPEELHQRYAELSELERLRESLPLPAGDLPDAEVLLGELHEATAVLAAPVFLGIRDYLDYAAQTKEIITSAGSPALARYWEGIPLPHPLAGRIEAVLDERGQVRDTAHPDLPRLRKRRERARREVNELLQRLLRGGKSRCFPEQPYVTQRNGRFVVPVKTEHQGEIPGLLQGVSSSGATVFLEPLAAVPLNNEYVYCQEQEAAIVHRLLQELTAQARGAASAIRQAIEITAALDGLAALLRFSEAYLCRLVPPAPDQDLILSGARHPLLEATLGRERTVAVDIELPQERRTLVVSGPNTGGKTAALKTAGLLTAMAHAGIPVPVSRGWVPLLAGIHADIGDHQSITEHLSTFSSHVRRMQSILETAQVPSLILIDEPGRGTDAAHGAALALAFLQAFQAGGHFLFVTTHHRRVKVWAAESPAATNAAVLLDPVTGRPSYHLQYGRTADSSGLQIAAQLGLSAELLRAARELLEPEEREIEKYLQALARQSEELEALRERQRDLNAALERQLEAFRRREDELRQRAEKAVNKLVAELEKRFEREMGRLLERLAGRLESEERRRRLRMEMQQRRAALKSRLQQQARNEVERLFQPESAPTRDDGISVGDLVVYVPLQAKGQVADISGDRVILEARGVRWEVPRHEVRKIESGPVTARPAPGVTAQVVRDTNPQLDLLGRTVEEAEADLDKFLDRAFLSGLEEIRIVHGVGTGRLRRFVQSYLAGHPHVSDYRNEGGSTWVRLKT
ncbi:MAG: endonuclease MutS2 [Acidobacteriota bacterium]